MTDGSHGDFSSYKEVKLALELNEDEIDFHATDIYIRYTADRYNHLKSMYKGTKTFQSGLDKTSWIEIPFFLLNDKIRARKTKK